MALRGPQTVVLGHLFGGSRGGDTQRVEMGPIRRPPNPLFHRAEVRKNREIIERTFSKTGKSSSGFSGIGVWLETFYGNIALA